MQIEYSNVVFPPGVIIHGKTTRAMSSKDGRKLVRVIEDGRDDLVVTSPGREEFHVPWSRTNGGMVISAKPKTAKVKFRPKAEEPAE